MSVTVAHAEQTEQRNGENGQENRKMRYLQNKSQYEDQAP